MKLLTKAIEAKLRDNSDRQELVRGTDQEFDFQPVCKLFTPWGAATWLLTELDPDGIAFGLCDLGMGCPELGSVSLDELRELRHPRFGLKVERDLHFSADKPLSAYADEARAAGRIVA